MSDGDLRRQTIAGRVLRRVDAAEQRVLLKIGGQAEAPAAELQLQGQVEEQKVEALGFWQLRAVTGVPKIGVLDARRKRDAEPQVVVEVPVGIGRARGRSRRVDGRAFHAV